MDKQAEANTKHQAKDARPHVGPDQTRMFNPQTQAYDVRLKTPAEIQLERATTGSGNSAARSRAG